jgi:predicted kinase
MSIEQVKTVGAELKELRINYNEPLVIVVFGNMGVGKTTIASQIGQRLGKPVLSSDYFRRKRFPNMQYKSWHSTVAMEDMLKEAQNLIDNGTSSVILDATFSKKEYRDNAKLLAEKNGKQVIWVEVVCQKDLVGSGNIDGIFVERKKDELSDIETRIVIDNSDRSKNKEEQIQELVDRVVVD